MTNIFVGNLSFDATESSIRSLFETHGTVERASLVTDRDTGRSRGFAFVEMSDSNGQELDGRALNVNLAKPKTERSGGGSRDGRSNRW